MNREYVDKYKKLYESHWWWRSREFAITRILENLKLPPEAQILDIGCGDGFFFPVLSKFGKTMGIELDSDMIAADSPYLDRIITGDLLELDLKAETFDLILALDVIEHIEDDNAALNKICKMLKPGGIAIISVPAFSFIWTAHDTINNHKRRYSSGDLKNKFESSGMVVKSFSYLYFTLVPLKLLQHFYEFFTSLFRKSSRVKSENIPPRIINFLAKEFFMLENKILTKLKIPIGSSLVMIGRK